MRICINNYLMLGAGGKNVAVKNWNGDIVEIVKYSKYLNDKERDAVTRYLASRYKIHISD